MGRQDARTDVVWMCRALNERVVDWLEEGSTELEVRSKVSWPSWVVCRIRVGSIPAGYLFLLNVTELTEAEAVVAHARRQTSVSQINEVDPSAYRQDSRIFAVSRGPLVRMKADNAPMCVGSPKRKSVKSGTRSK